MDTKKSQNNNNKMEFGMRIARNSILEEIKNGCNKNLVISPLSIHIALNMLASGSTGRTLEQLLGFLESDSITQLNDQSSLLMELAIGDVTNDDLPAPDDSIHQKPSIKSGNYSPNFSPAQFYQNSSSDGPTYSPNYPVYQPIRPLYPSYNHCGPYYSSYNQNPINESGPIICLVNGIWVDKRTPMKHSFKQLAEDVYKANAQSVDFLNQGAQFTNEINAWAREASKGHIDRLFSNTISKDAILVLANALYFKGTWVDPFYSNSTKDEDFYLLNGEIVRVPFMKSWNTYNFYGSFEGFKLLRMRYNFRKLDNKRYAMYIHLPDKKDGLKELVEKFNSDPRIFIESRSHLQHVKLNNVWVPKLKYEYELKALKSMKEFGLDLPFDDKRCEMAELVETNSEVVVYVSEAIQKAYIEVNEEGTITTAVTSFTNAAPSYSPTASAPPTISFVADHPFLFMIKEEVSDTVLFVGAALNPLA